MYSNCLQYEILLDFSLGAVDIVKTHLELLMIKVK